jgi:hypothetical protein
MRKILFLLAGLIIVSGCAGKYVGYKPVKDLVTLEVAFVNSHWNGLTVPSQGRCKKCGGDGKSPSVVVRGIPDGANAVVIEFNDLNDDELSSEGGHGAIWVAAQNRYEVIIPSIPEETLKLPLGVFLESRHRSSTGQTGAYLGPCACEERHTFVVVAKAVYKPQLQGEQALLLGQGELVMGQCCN